MGLDHRHTLMERMLANPRAQVFDEERTSNGSIDPSVYLQQERLDREVSDVLRRLPLVVGHTSELTRPGSQSAKDLLGTPVLLARDRSSRVRVFLNACRHRGTRLLKSGETRQGPSFVCPYHNWTYGLDGVLMHVPCESAFPNFDRAAKGLIELPSREAGGLIWASLDPDAQVDWDAFLAEIDQDLTGLKLPEQVEFRTISTVRQCNWKLVLDAFLESYHIQRLHKHTIAPFFMDNVATLEQVGQHIRTAVARERFAELADLPRDQWDEREHVTMAYILFPNTVMIFHPDYVSLITLWPEAPDRTRFCHTMLIPAELQTPDWEDHWDKSLKLIEGGVFQAEDLFVCEEIQAGLRARPDEAIELGQYETGIRIYHDILDAALAGD